MGKTPDHYPAEFHTITADPPWNERGGGKIKRGADRHYPLLTEPQIIETMLCAPPWRPAPNCHLWLWVTNNHLRAGLRVMDALGFRYVTNLAWVKVKAGARDQVRIGLGQYLRGAHELCLFGVRGRQRALARNVPSAILAPRTAHSAKPQEIYKVIERVSPGPRLEMFSRGAAEPDWWQWGEGADGIGGAP